MKNSSLYTLPGASILGMAITDASALATGSVYPAVSAAEAGVPAAFAALVWGPVIALMVALGLGLFWLLREPAVARKAEGTAVRRAPARKPRPARRMRSPAPAQRRLHRHLPGRSPLPV
jgi:hypothetical protein